MTVTIDRFELVPGDSAPAPARDAARTESEGGKNVKPSRHQLACALRLEHERALRVRAT
jgi:hypothetical protein